MPATHSRPGDPAVEIGLAFLVCGPVDIVGNSDPVQAAQIRADAVDEMIRATGEAFLGLTVGCARCHDHKFDPITQRDYYSLYATLAGVHHDDRIVASEEQKRDRAAKLATLETQKKQIVDAKARARKTFDRTTPACQERKLKRNWPRSIGRLMHYPHSHHCRSGDSSNQRQTSVCSSVATPSERASTLCPPA